MVDGVAGLAARLGHRFARPELLEQALCHRSWCSEQGGAPSNERLEYLGDAVLGLVVAEHTFHRFPELPEGQLAKIRAGVVNARVLADVAKQLGIGDELRLGRGEEASQGRSKASILADALEAVIGAIYVDAGWSEAERLVLGLLSDRIESAAAEPGGFDHKSLLQELTVHEAGGPPRYEVVGTGPDHERHFRAEVFVGGLRRGVGEGPSKKEAEQAAARAAWLELRLAGDHDGIPHTAPATGGGQHA
ncbi:MAG: ribonuclease III [Actinomycetota bacterium]|jgi:ribonuclease-3|nr:ribonuclease III [Actinomycetota bacterium]